MININKDAKIIEMTNEIATNKNEKTEKTEKTEKNKTNNNISFKKLYNLEERKDQSKRMLINPKYQDKVAIVCEPMHRSKLKKLEQVKFLVPDKFKIYQFTDLIRKRISLEKDMGLYLHIAGKKLARSDARVDELYRQYKDEDDFLYIEYTEQESFGSPISSTISREVTLPISEQINTDINIDINIDNKQESDFIDHKSTKKSFSSLMNSLTVGLLSDY